MKLDKWQEEVLAYEGDLVLCTGRQVGKTTIFARKAAIYLLNNPGHQIIICSLTEDQAKLIIVMIQDYLEKNLRPMIVKGKLNPTLNRITLKNKATALARPVGNTGDALRGFTGDVLIIDEASRMSELIFEAAEPVLMTTGGQIWMCSTPFGKTGYFYRCYHDDKFKRIHVNTEDVAEKRLETQRTKLLELLKDEKLRMTKLQYQQEYQGLVVGGIKRLLSA